MAGWLSVLVSFSFSYNTIFLSSVSSPVASPFGESSLNTSGTGSLRVRAQWFFQSSCKLSPINRELKQRSFLSDARQLGVHVLRSLALFLLKCAGK